MKDVLDTIWSYLVTGKSFPDFVKMYLLPSGSKQYEVLLFGSIQEGIPQARHYIVQIDKTH